MAQAAAVCLQWLDCCAPAVMMVSHPLSKASRIKYSSFRVLFPPEASPVWSSRLMKML